VRRLREYLRERLELRLRILRLLRVAGLRLVGGALAFQLFTGLAPVAFILATSTVVGRVPAACCSGYSRCC